MGIRRRTTASFRVSARTSLKVSRIEGFESIARRAYRFTEAPSQPELNLHAFEFRNIHPDFPTEVRRLFDNGHFAQSTLEAFKFVDEEIQRITGSSEFGTSLMMKAFSGSPPAVALNPGMTRSEKDEQEGYKFLFAGSMLGIRNPRGHKTAMADDPDLCLDHLGLASMLLRRLDDTGLR